MAHSVRCIVLGQLSECAVISALSVFVLRSAVLCWRTSVLGSAVAVHGNVSLLSKAACRVVREGILTRHHLAAISVSCEVTCA